MIMKIEKYINIYSIFLLSFLFHLPLIFQGLDVTDEGYHLTHQVASFASKVDVDCISLPYFLSDFVGGFWLSLIGMPCLIWARIGGLLLISVNSSIIYSILSIYFDRHKALAAVLITSLFITIRSGYIIDYYSFPAFLLCIQLWLFNQIIKHSWEGKNNDRFSFLLGFLTIPIILSRIPLLLLLFIPAILFIYYKFLNKDLSIAIHVSKISAIGMASSVIFFSFFYWHLGILSSLPAIIDIMWGSAIGRSESHNMTDLLMLYLRCYRLVFDLSILLVFGFLILIKFIKILKIDNCYKQQIPVLITIIVLFLIEICVLYRPEIANTLAYVLSSESIGFVLIFAGIYFYYTQGSNLKLKLLLIAGVIIMMMNHIGSNTGIYKSSYGMWLVFPLSILCVDQVWGRISCIRSDFRLSFLKSALTIFLILAIFFQFSNIYRDVPNRLELDTAFSDSSLFGIFSTAERVEVVDEMLSQIKRYAEKNDEILIVGVAPMFYYLTETKPAMGHPWLFLLSEEMIQIKQQKSLDRGSYPKFVIISKVETEYWTWPDDKMIGSETEPLKYNYLINVYINKLNYTFLWENRAFALYGRTKS